MASLSSVQELEELLALGHESRAFEVKGPGHPGDKPYSARVAKAVMAMGNLRNGGLVCLGIDDNRMQEMLPGLTADQVAEWIAFDEASTAIARYSDPPPTFHPKKFRLSSGVDVVVLEVEEFQDVPHLCRKDYGAVLQEGRMYVRPRGMPKSVQVPNSQELRDVIEIATDKSVRQFLRRAREAGVPLLGTGPGSVTDLSHFDREREQAWEVSSPITERITSAGHTDIAVRPEPYSQQRISPAQLEPFLEQQTVRLRGWPVPYRNPRKPLDRHGRWIGQDIEPRTVPHMESWRLCTSGQFLHRRVLATDMRDSADLVPTVANATGAVAVWDIVLYMVEVAEFAARVGTALRCDQIGFDIDLAGIAGRQLIAGEPGEHLRGVLIVHADRLNASRQIDTKALLADVRSTGVGLAQDLLQQFGLDVSDRSLFDLQERVFGP